MQEPLFSASENITLPGGAPITIHRGWLSESDADAFFHSLNNSMRWNQPSITIAGQQKRIPRLQAWFGESYAYSGTRLAPAPLTEELRMLKQLVETECKHVFNSVLVNLYRDENDSVGWHADDEPELGANPLIASLSLGQTRRFLLKPKPHFVNETTWYNHRNPISIPLSSGDLLVMGKDVQVDWLHCVPKESKAHQPRINLTFRLVI